MKTVLTILMSILLVGFCWLVGLVGAWDECDCSACPGPEDQQKADSRRPERVPTESGLQRRLEELPICDPVDLQKLRQDVEKLQAKADLMKNLSDGYRAAGEGTPAAWPEHIPVQFTPDHFQATFAQVLDELEMEAELLGFDCSEPPCIARLRMLGEKTYFRMSGSVM